MGALPLSPRDNNYLTSSILFKQMQQNSVELELETDNCEAVVIPKLSLDGSGRGYLTGSLKLTGETPAAEIGLFKLPPFLSIAQDYIFPVAEYIDADGDYGFNAIRLLNSSGGISSITIDDAGSYTVLPTLSTTGPGAGATFSLRMKVIGAGVDTIQSGAGSYAPGDTIHPAGGTSSIAAIFTVAQTQVASATIDDAGTGGTPGTQTVTGTTGTGTKFEATVTVSGGGIITSVDSISVRGVYTVNPTSLTAEPVTGGGLTGAKLSLKMGVLGVTPSTPGSYTVLPSNPASQSSSSGAGTGATFNVVWGILSIGVTAKGDGYDDTSAIVISDDGGGAASIVLGSQNAQVIGVLANSSAQDNVIQLDGIVFFVNSY